MKFLCTPCNEYMDYIRHGAINEGALDIGFVCPKCGRGISLITNTGETQLVSSFGVNLGGGEASTPPMQVTSLSLKTDSPAGSKICWGQAAEDRLHGIPKFARAMAKRAIERYAYENDIDSIDLLVMDKVRETVGH